MEKMNVLFLDGLLAVRKLLEARSIRAASDDFPVRVG